MPGGRLEMIGWVLFAASGVVFLISALRERDMLLAWGSIMWLVGVAVFLAGYRSREG